MRGVLITFEGGEGCGKTTQAQRLAGRLKAAGREAVCVNEPGSTPVGAQIRQLLLHAAEGQDLAPRAELLLFGASRAQLVERVVSPALDRGAAVLSDRFTDSTAVYQGCGRGLDPAFIAALNEFATGGLTPDLTFLLDLDLATARARLLRRVRPAGVTDRMEALPEAFYERVRAGYLALASRAPERVRVLDGRKGPEVLENEIWEVTDGFLRQRGT